jgi:predicted Zn finger-like uncharacterized protein
VIAACPQCQTRYRLAREKIGPQGARIRCSQCQTIFRVQAPPAGAPPTPAEAKPSPVAAPAPKPAPAAPPPKPAAPPAPPKPLPPLARALVAEVDGDSAKAASEILAQWRIEAEIVDDGAEALLRMFRTPPALAILGADLPSLGGSRIAEIAQRASELAAVKLIRIATATDQTGTPGFDAEEMLEAGDFPAGLPDLLAKLGIGAKPSAAPPAARVIPPPAPAVAPKPAAAPPVAKPAPAVAKPAPPAAAARPAPPAPAPAPAAAPARKVAAAAPPVANDPAVAAAERLARIAVSDVILYNQEKFAAAAARGTAAKELASELGEARQHFNSRVAPAVREKRDFLVEEIERRAAALRGG